MKIFSVAFVFCLLFATHPSAYAQKDTGFASCNQTFRMFMQSIDSAGTDMEAFRLQFPLEERKWKECISSYRVPDFSATTASGDSFHLSEVKQKIVVRHFWSLNCPLCVPAMKAIEKLSKEYCDTEVLFVSLTTAGRKQAERHSSEPLTTIPNALS